MAGSSLQSKSKPIRKSKKGDKVFNNKKGEDSSDVFEIIVEDQEEEKKQ